jgi:hypothetical protein
MRPMTIYVADDGSRWDDAEKAQQRDMLHAACQEILLMMPPRPGTVDGYIQHDRETVMRVKLRTLQLAQRELDPCNRTAWFKDLDKVSMSAGGLMARIISEAGGPLNKVWWRLNCIDAHMREWEQPYFALHPSEGKQVCLNPIEETKAG